MKYVIIERKIVGQIRIFLSKKKKKITIHKQEKILRIKSIKMFRICEKDKYRILSGFKGKNY